MTQPTYAVARTAADRIHRHIESHPIRSKAAVGMLPDAAILAGLIDVAFWTSLRREEIYTPRISLAFVAPEQIAQPISFGEPLPLTPHELTKLAAAADRPGIHLCVWPKDGKPAVWGVARYLPPLCLVLEIVIPGLLVIKRSPLSETGKFLNIAVLQGDEVKIIDPVGTTSPAGPALLASLLRMEAQFATGSAVNVLLQLAVSMRAHGRGGILLVVPASSDAWQESCLQPITYAVKPAYSGLADLTRKDETRKATRRWENAMARAVDGIAGCTAVDGATVITANYELLAFGAKVVRRPRQRQVSRVIVTEPVEGGSAVSAIPAQLGGTRHLAAAQFVHDQHDSIALVASQDGRFTVFGWSPDEEKVHAHRIDALLL